MIQVSTVCTRRVPDYTKSPRFALDEFCDYTKTLWLALDEFCYYTKTLRLAPDKFTMKLKKTYLTIVLDTEENKTAEDSFEDECVIRKGLNKLHDQVQARQGEDYGSCPERHWQETRDKTSPGLKADLPPRSLVGLESPVGIDQDVSWNILEKHSSPWFQLEENSRV